MRERDFAAEIAAASGDAVRLRQLAKEIADQQGDRILTIRALDLARRVPAEAKSDSHPLGRVGRELGLPYPVKGQPLYGYRLEPGIWESIAGLLRDRLQHLTTEPGHNVSALFVLWAADWFRRHYDGGIASWERVGRKLGVRLQQSQWRALSDRGFQMWGIRPIHSGAGELRLMTIATQAGFPVGAITDGGHWAARFLKQVVGELLGSGLASPELARDACARNEALVPATWRRPEMWAIAGELAYRVAALRRRAEQAGRAEGETFTECLDRIEPGWRGTLPMALEGAAGFVDTLLQAPERAPGGTIAVRRLLRQTPHGWEEYLELLLAGQWQDRDLAAVHQQRVFLVGSGRLAEVAAGRLAFLEQLENGEWHATPMVAATMLAFPFAAAAAASLMCAGRQLGTPFSLPGGERVADGLRVLRRRQSRFGSVLELVGVGSGGYVAEELWLDLPVGWSIADDDGRSEIDAAEPLAHPSRRLVRIRGRVVVEAADGDRFLVRTGQSAASRDRLHVTGAQLPGIQARAEHGKILRQPIWLRATDTEGSVADVRALWRPRGETRWRPEPAQALGPCEFAWRDGTTGHLRAKDEATVLPADFAVHQRTAGGWTEISILGWPGDVQIDESRLGPGQSRRLRTDPPSRNMVPVRLASPGLSAFDLQVPLPTRAFLWDWEGGRIPQRRTLGLADLTEIVARAPNEVALLGYVQGVGGAGSYSDWGVNGEIGLSALRDDVAAAIRPLGIDARLELNFHNGIEDCWYVTEFGNRLERTAGGRLVPKSPISDDDVVICGRGLHAPEQEKVLGAYAGTRGTLGGQPVLLPRLGGRWLVYLRRGNRVLTRPFVHEGAAPPPVAQHRLGRVMAQPFAAADSGLSALLAQANADPDAPETRKLALDLIRLATSLQGLPPRTFRIFEKFENAGVLAPLMLYLCEEAHIPAILDLFAGLPSSWTVLPRSAWWRAFDALGRHFLGIFGDMELALGMVDNRAAAIANHAPELEPLVSRRPARHEWDDIFTRFRTHTAASVNPDRPNRNPFRPRFEAQLVPEKFAPAILRVLDAPFVAALTALGRAQPELPQKLAIKDVARRHPNYFAMAYAHALNKYAEDADVSF